MHALYGVAQCSQYGYMYLLYNGISWDTFNQVFIIGEPGDKARFSPGQQKATRSWKVGLGHAYYRRTG